MDTEPEEEDDANEDNDDKDELGQFADDDAWSKSLSMAKSFSNQLKNSSCWSSVPHQSLETKRKEADEAINKNHAVFQTLLAKAEEKYKPYSEVDMLLASKTMEAEDFALLRKEAQDAGNDLKFLREEADKFYQDVQAQNQKAMQDAAKQAIEVLENDIPEWSNDLYNDIRAYAIEQGMDEATKHHCHPPSRFCTKRDCSTKQSRLRPRRKSLPRRRFLDQPKHHKVNVKQKHVA